MNISNHCFQRYHERVREAEGPFIDSLKERYTKELEQMYEHCKKIYSGIIGHSSRPVDVYVNPHGWVLITNDREKTMITIYKIDLGIGNDALNKQYITESLKRIDDMQDALLKQLVTVDEQKAEYNQKIEANEALIKEYRQTIAALEEQNSAFRAVVRNIDASNYKAQTELRDAIENYMVKDCIKIDVNI